MKRIKKIFKFLPALVLTFVSGLMAVINTKENISSVSADNDYLMSSRSISNFDYTYTSAGNVQSGLKSMTFHYFYDLEFYLYNRLSDNTFYYVLNYRHYIGRDYVVCNSVTYNSAYAIDSYVDYTLTSSNFTLTGSSVDFNIKFDRTNTNTDWYFSGDYISNHYLTGWYVTQRINITYGTSNYLYMYLPKGVDSSNDGSNYYIMMVVSDSTFSTDFKSTRVVSSSNVPIVSYTVDLSRSNYDLGYEEGYNAGYQSGFNNGFNSGNSSGIDIGYNNGYEDGYSAGVAGTQTAYDNGYAAGVAEAANQSAVANSIFDGIIRIGILPVQFFLSVFNFEVFGINVSVIITSLLAVAVTVILIRYITGKKV